MKVFINNRELVIFKGAILQDAVLAYSKHAWKMTMNGKLFLYDRFGNRTEPDGPVYDGQKFFLKRKSS